MATDRRADVTWQGSLMEGSGTIRSTTSGKLGEQKVSWPNRSEDNPDATSPEELNTSATVTFQPGEGITKIALTVEGRVPGIDDAAFQEAANGAKANCPVSKALAGVPEITLEARLT